MKISKIRFTLVLVSMFLLEISTANAQNADDSGGFLSGDGKGFVTLFDGKSDYEGRDNGKNAIGSFFLVRLWDDYNFFLGAVTFASFDTVSESIVDIRDSGDTAEISLNSSFQHRMYGTMFGYVYNSKGLLALQVWGGAGYVTNLIEIETDINESVTGSTGLTYQCSGSTSGNSTEVTSYPLMIGVGVTFWEFGVYLQTMTQTVDPVELTQSGTVTCSRGDSTDSHTIENDQKIAVAFTSTQIGIQYWF
jgi:hypothetical protein